MGKLSISQKHNSVMSLPKMFKYTKGIIRSPYSKDRQYNDQKQRNKMINIGLQNIKQKTK